MTGTAPAIRLSIEDEDIHDKALFRLLTGGKRENQHRIMVVPIAFFVIGGILAIPLFVLIMTASDVNITAFPTLESLVIGSYVTSLLVFAAILASGLVMRSLIDKPTSVDSVTRENLKRYVRSVRSLVVFALVIAILVNIQPMIYGNTHYRSNSHIYGVYESTRAGPIEGNVTGELVLEGIHEVVGNVTFDDLTIRPGDVDIYGLIIGIGSSILLRNCTLDGTDGTGLIFQCGGQVRAENTTFIRLLTEDGPSLSPGMVLYGSKSDAVFERCTFQECRDEAVTIVYKPTFFYNCTFEGIRDDVASIFDANVTMDGCHFTGSNRAVKAVNARIIMLDCTVRDCGRGIYTENSRTVISNSSFVGIDGYAIRFYDDRPVLLDVGFVDCGSNVEEHGLIWTQAFCFIFSPAGSIIIALALITAQLLNDRAINKKLDSMTLDDRTIKIEVMSLFPDIVVPERNELMRSRSLGIFLIMFLLPLLLFMAAFFVGSFSEGALSEVSLVLGLFFFGASLLSIISAIIEGNFFFSRYFSYNGDGLFFHQNGKRIDRFVYIPWKNVTTVKNKWIPYGVLIKPDSTFENKGKGIIRSERRNYMVTVGKKDRERFMSVYGLFVKNH